MTKEEETQLKEREIAALEERNRLDREARSAPMPDAFTSANPHRVPVPAPPAVFAVCRLPNAGIIGLEGSPSRSEGSGGTRFHKPGLHPRFTDASAENFDVAEIERIRKRIFLKAGNSLPDVMALAEHRFDPTTAKTSHSVTAAILEKLSAELRMAIYFELRIKLLRLCGLTLTELRGVCSDVVIIGDADELPEWFPRKIQARPAPGPSASAPEGFGAAEMVAADKRVAFASPTGPSRSAGELSRRVTG